MRAIALLALALLGGCGPFRPFEPIGRVSVNGLAGIELEDERDGECLERQATRALELVRPITGATDFSGITVWIRASDEPYKLDSWAVGNFIPPSDIQENRWGGSLAHELLHVYEIEHLGVPRDVSARHEGWEERGWTKLGDDFYRSTTTWGTNFCP
jgi:hypothetical protein